MTRKHFRTEKIIMNYAHACFLLVAGACLTPSITLAKTVGAPLTKLQQPFAAETNSPGDIPDNQAFVEYRSTLGFSIKVPEGWARREQASDVSFSDKYNRLQVTVSEQTAPSTLANVKANEVSALQKLPIAVRIVSAKQLALPAGSVVVVHYSANSEVNAVTNKAIRLDNENYYFWKAGKLAVLTLSAPAGADNVDQWQLMAKSFTWR